MGQCSSTTSEKVHEQFNETATLTTIMLTEKRIADISHGKLRSEQNDTRTPADRRRHGCNSHDDCAGLVFVADPTGGVWIDNTMGRQR